MSTVTALPLESRFPIRAFTLHLVRDPRRPDTYGLTVDETYGHDPARRLGRPAATLGATTARHILDRALTAVVDSGHRPSALAIHRAKPIPLDEAAGVRLALTILAVAPVRSADAIRRTAAGVAAMSTEETYYWYSLCTGKRAATSRKALRVLLSEA